MAAGMEADASSRSVGSARTRSKEAARDRAEAGTAARLPAPRILKQQQENRSVGSMSKGAG